MGKRKVGQTLQGTFEEHQTNRRGKQKAGKLGKPTNRDLGEMELGLYEEDDSETDFDDDGEPSRQNVIAARHNGKNSANSPAANQLRMPAAMKANNKPHGRPGLEMASEMEEQFAFYKRAICDANLLGFHTDSHFYATGDTMVCQFVQTACGEQWNPESSREQDKVAEAKRQIGEPNFIRYRKMCSEAIGSRRAELTSGERGLKKAAARYWGLDKILQDRGEDAEKEEKLRLLSGGTYHYGEHGTPLAHPTFLRVITHVYKTLELSPPLLAWSLVVLEEYFKGQRMANDDVSSKQKMVEKGDVLLRGLKNLTGKQKKVPRVETLFRDVDTTVAGAVRLRKQAEVARKRQRRNVDLASLDWVPADFAPSAQPKDDHEAEGAASSPGVVVAALRSASDGVEPPARKRLVKDFDRESDDERNVTESQPDGRGSGVTRSGGAGAHAKGEAPRRPSPPTQEQESPERVPGKVAELENPVRAPDRPANGEEPAGVASEKEGCVKTPGASMSALSPASMVEEDKQLLRAAIHGPPEAEAVSVGRESITNGMISGLLGPNFVGQEIINGYTTLLKRREFDARNVDEIELPHSVFLTTFFHQKYLQGNKQYKSVERWVKGLEPLMDYDQVFMPIHWSSEVHWTLAVAYPQELKIVYFDPMLEPDEQTSKAALEALDDLGKFITDDMVQRALKPNFKMKKKTLSGRPRGALPSRPIWEVEVYDEENFPRQTDGTSCGIFLLKFMEFMSRSESLEGLDAEISQDDVKRYRRAIAVELLHNKVELPPSKEREDDGSRLVAQPENGQLSQTQ